MTSESIIAKAAKKLGYQNLIASCSRDQWEAIQTHWPYWARPEQLEPSGDWNTWFILAGRAWGKSRTGAEAVRKWALQYPGCHIALVARTAADVRDVMVRALLTPWKGGQLTPEQTPLHEPSNRRLVWSNGSTATTYSAEEPNALRGPQHDLYWADEPAAWQYPHETFHEGIKMGLRGSGAAGLNLVPRGVVTTTPRNTAFIRELVKSPGVHITRGSTYDNAANLPDAYITEMRERYDGTRLGRQEIHAELLDNVEGALWTHDLIDRARIREALCQMLRIVVAVDPAGSAKKTADEAGIVVAGVGDCGCKGKVERHGFVFEDLSGRYSPRDMGDKAIAAYRQWDASRIVAEDNFGGKLVEDLMRLIDPTIAYRAVHASRGKIIRAEPVAALYEQGRVHHVGLFRELEDEMTQFAPMIEKKVGQLAASKSPGRLDALVWALSDLMLGESDASFGAKEFKSPSFTFAESQVPVDWDNDD